jgi:hypothetical protein
LSDSLLSESQILRLNVEICYIQKAEHRRSIAGAKKGHKNIARAEGKA